MRAGDQSSIYIIAKVCIYILYMYYMYVYSLSKILKGSVSIPVYSEIYCMYYRLHCIRSEQNSLHIQVPPETKCQFHFPFTCMIFPIVIKCSLTAQSVFTCRHIPVLYTVAMVKIFFTVGINNNMKQMSHNFVGLSFLYIYSLSISLLSNLLIMTSQSVIVSFLSISAQKVRCESYRASDYLSEKSCQRKKKHETNQTHLHSFPYNLSSSSNNY